MKKREKKIHFLKGDKKTYCGVQLVSFAYISSLDYEEVTCANCKKKVEVYKRETARSLV